MDTVTQLCLQEPESNSYCTLGSQNQMVTEQDCETLLVRLQDSKRASSRSPCPHPALPGIRTFLCRHAKSPGAVNTQHHTPGAVMTSWVQQSHECPTLQTAPCHSPGPHIRPQLPGSPTLYTKVPELKILTSNLFS